MKNVEKMYVENIINCCNESGPKFQVLRIFLLVIQAKTALVRYVV